MAAQCCSAVFSRGFCTLFFSFFWLFSGCRHCCRQKCNPSWPAMAELAAAQEEDAWSDEDWQAFPPLYTLQPHAATREAQLNVWIELLWRWCKAQNSWTVDVASCDVFVNDAINRRLDEKGRREVAKAACRAGRGESAYCGRAASVDYRH